MEAAIRRTVAVAAFAMVVFIAAERTHSNDFWAYYWAATHAASDPHAVYEAVPRDAFGKDVPPFLYAPTAILLFIPLAHFAPSAAAWVWFGISILGAAVATSLIFQRIWRAGHLPTGMATVLAVSTFFNYPFYATLLTGQVNILVGLLLLGFYTFDVPGSDPRTARACGTGVGPQNIGRPIASGFCLAAAIAVKLYPAIFVLLLVRKRRLFDVFVVMAFLAAFLAATLLLFPPVLWYDWFTRVASSGGFGDPLPALARDLEAYNISLNGTLMRMLGPGPLAGRLAVTSGTLMLAWSLARSSDAARIDPREMAAIALVMICAAPVSWAHHLAMLIPLAALALPSLTHTLLAAVFYASICFKWDWSFGSAMLGAIAPATAGAIALWALTLPRRTVS